MDSSLLKVVTKSNKSTKTFCVLWGSNPRVLKTPGLKSGPLDHSGKDT